MSTVKYIAVHFAEWILKNNYVNFSINKHGVYLWEHFGQDDMTTEELYIKFLKEKYETNF
jgi:hypothetical protein